MDLKLQSVNKLKLVTWWKRELKIQKKLKLFKEKLHRFLQEVPILMLKRNNRVLILILNMFYLFIRKMNLLILDIVILNCQLWNSLLDNFKMTLLIKDLELYNCKQGLLKLFVYQASIKSMILSIYCKIQTYLLQLH
jgi:hypothetical protein